MSTPTTYTILVTGLSGENIAEGVIRLRQPAANRLQDKLQASLKAGLIAGWFMCERVMAPPITSGDIQRQIWHSFREKGKPGIPVETADKILGIWS